MTKGLGSLPLQCECGARFEDHEAYLAHRRLPEGQGHYAITISIKDEWGWGGQIVDDYRRPGAPV